MTEKKTPPEAEAEEQDVGPLKLGEALLRVQAKVDGLDLGRNADGQIQSRTYKYLTYAKLLEQVRPLLIENELLWQTFPTTTEDGQPALRYRMAFVHTEEAQIGTMLLAIDEHSTSQQQGSAISYARRYALMAVLEIAPDDDDDGGAASEAPRQRARQRQSEARHAPTLLNADQLQAMSKAIKDVGLDIPETLRRAGIEEPLRVTAEQAKAVNEIIEQERTS